MAQKDITDIADYMKQIDESIQADEAACDEANRECEEQQALEDAELEDEVIDKESLGFIDDADACEESDDFYSEDDQQDTFEEDVSDCMQQENDDPVQTASLEVEVYNDDDFGKFFTKEVNRNVPGVTAVVKKTLPNGDLLVKMSGEQGDLENAFAFYLGKEDYSQLTQDDKEDFESRLVFDDGDTLAEADYREAVAHCLDDIDVNASTANLADQDTCAISIIKEEKARRFAKKALKCLKEDDFSSLSDDELDKLDKIKDAVENGEPLDSKDSKVWQMMLKDMGYTQAQWDAMSPEERDKAWEANPENKPAGINKTGFGPAQYKHVLSVPSSRPPSEDIGYVASGDPEPGSYVTHQFNPNYDMEHSMVQHPSAAKRQAKKDAAELEQIDREKTAKAAMKAARGKGSWDEQGKATWNRQVFAQMLTGLSSKERKALMNDLIDSVKKDHPDDPGKAGEEAMFIKKIFGQKLTLRDFASAWDKSAPGVMKFLNATIDIWKQTCEALGIKSIGQFKAMPEGKFNQFLQLLKINMEGRRSGSIVAGR